MDWINNAVACPVLKGVDPQRLREVFTDVHFQVKKYQQEDVIAQQGDEVNCLMILLKGSVRGEMTDYSGRMIKIEDIQAPKPIAGAFLFGRQNVYPVDIIANESSVILKIFRDQFLKLLQLCPTVQLNYLNLISTKAQFLSNKIKFLSFKTLKGKIAHYILQLEIDEDGYMLLPQTQQAMADLFGAARPSVARAFGQMEAEGVLELSNRRVKVFNRDNLLAYFKE
ncbi:MAG: Crp/Fnr family transcriptional regulator [Bacteroidales bacterium]|nr:Crp/Fnr family transcriptional regulator [Bacteroidales bacterium]